MFATSMHAEQVHGLEPDTGTGAGAGSGSGMDLGRPLVGSQSQEPMVDDGPARFIVYTHDRKSNVDSLFARPSSSAAPGAGPAMHSYSEGSGARRFSSDLRSSSSSSGMSGVVGIPVGRGEHEGSAAPPTAASSLSDVDSSQVSSIHGTGGSGGSSNGSDDDAVVTSYTYQHQSRAKRRAMEIDNTAATGAGEAGSYQQYSSPSLSAYQQYQQQASMAMSGCYAATTTTATAAAAYSYPPQHQQPDFQVSSSSSTSTMDWSHSGTPAHTTSTATAIATAAATTMTTTTTTAAAAAATTTPRQPAPTLSTPSGDLIPAQSPAPAAAAIIEDPLLNPVELASANARSAPPTSPGIVDMANEPQDSLIEMLSSLLEQLVSRNDTIPVRELTHFHAKTPPLINIQSYLQRFAKYAPIGNECFVLFLVYLDRLVQRTGLVINSLNVHRLILTGLLLASKFCQDKYYTNRHFAKVGGLPHSELNMLEVEFLTQIDFELTASLEWIEKYFVQLKTHFARKAQEAEGKTTSQHPGVPAAAPATSSSSPA